MSGLPVSALHHPPANASHPAPEHTRFVYGLQEATASDDSDDAAFSDDSSFSSRRTARRHVRSGKKRMSVVTNQYLDIPRVDDSYHELVCSGDPVGVKASSKRRFFQSRARWDTRLERVLAEREPYGYGTPTLPVENYLARGANIIPLNVPAPPMDVDEVEDEEEGR